MSNTAVPAVDAGADFDTWTVTRLLAHVDSQIRSLFDETVWVTGEWSNRKQLSGGGVAVDIVERRPNSQNAAGVLSAWISSDRTSWLRRTLTGADIKLREGTPVRVGGTLNMRSKRGQLQLNITAIDVDWIKARQVIAREQLIAELRDNGTLARQQRHRWPNTISSIALISSVGSAGYHDFINTLDAARHDIAVLALDTRVQGDNAVVDLVRKLNQIRTYTAQRAWKPDVVAVIRGGGSKADLAAFDDRRVVEALAELDQPVLCGIGHEIDTSICDLAAHTSTKTPTAAAQKLLETNRTYLDRVVVAATAVAGRSQANLDHSRTRLERGGRSVDELTGASFDRVAGRHSQLAEAAQAGATRSLDQAAALLDGHRTRVSDHTASALTQADQRLDHYTAIVEAHDPARALERGYTITRRSDGTLVRDIDVTSGEPLTIRTAAGTIDATVNSTPTAKEPT